MKNNYENIELNIINPPGGIIIKYKTNDENNENNENNENKIDEDIILNFAHNLYNQNMIIEAKKYLIDIMNKNYKNSNNNIINKNIYELYVDLVINNEESELINVLYSNDDIITKCNIIYDNLELENITYFELLQKLIELANPIIKGEKLDKNIILKFGELLEFKNKLIDAKEYFLYGFEIDDENFIKKYVSLKIPFEEKYLDLINLEKKLNKKIISNNNNNYIKYFNKKEINFIMNKI